MMPEDAINNHLDEVDADDAGPCAACGASSPDAQVEHCPYEGRLLCKDCRAIWDEVGT